MNIRFFTLASIVVTVSLLRLLPHPPNFTPVLAVALFAGAQFTDKRIAFIIPLAAMLLADLIIGLHTTLFFVYLSVAIAVLLGIVLQKYYKVFYILSTVLSSWLLFFLITNFGAWLSLPEFYSRSLNGLLLAYAAAIPFALNSLLGDLFYAAILFGGFSWVQRQFPRLGQQPLTN